MRSRWFSLFVLSSLQVLVSLQALESEAREASRARALLDFTHDTVVFCGEGLSWSSLLLKATLEQTECLDRVSPIRLHSENDQEKLSASKLVSLLKEARSACLADHEVRIPESVKLRRLSHLDRKLFEPWVMGKLDNSEKEIELGHMSIPNLTCSEGLSFQRSDFRLTAKNTYRFTLHILNKRHYVSGDFKVFDQVPVAVRRLGVQDRLQTSDFKIQKRDVTFLLSPPISMDELVGRTLVRPVFEGEPISLNVLKPEWAIEKGQVIQAQYQGDQFLLTVGVIAEQSGWVGDTIKIKSSETHKILSGVILKKGVVEVR